jgi:hypothetical protein
MASQPSLRIGDAERNGAAAELREHYAHGRLTLVEFNHRLDAVFAAKTQRDLSRVTSDLPHVRPADVPLPSERIGKPSQASHRPASPVRRPGSDDWQRGRRHHPGGFAAFATLLAALGAWLLVYQVILVGLQWSLPGRLGLLVAVFTVLRGILRRIFGWPGRRTPSRGRRR